MALATLRCNCAAADSQGMTEAQNPAETLISQITHLGHEAGVSSDALRAARFRKAEKREVGYASEAVDAWIEQQASTLDDLWEKVAVVVYDAFAGNEDARALRPQDPSSSDDLAELLVKAQHWAKEMENEARTNASRIVADAKAKAEEIEEKSRTLEATAQRRADEAFAEAAAAHKRELEQLEANLASAEARWQEMRRRMAAELARFQGLMEADVLVPAPSEVPKEAPPFAPTAIAVPVVAPSHGGPAEAAWAPDDMTGVEPLFASLVPSSPLLPPPPPGYEIAPSAPAREAAELDEAPDALITELPVAQPAGEPATESVASRMELLRQRTAH